MDIKEFTMTEINNLLEEFGERELSPIEQLRDAVLERIEYFKTDEGFAYGKYVLENGQAVTARLESKQFKHFVRRVARELGISPSPTYINTAVEEVQAQADISAQKAVYLRSAWVDDAIHYFTGTMEAPAYTVIDVPSGTVSAIGSSPIEYLPNPDYRQMNLALGQNKSSDEIIEILKKYLNVEDEQNLYLIIVWLCSALVPESSWQYPQLNFVAGKGSGKTTGMEFCRKIVDLQKESLIIFPSGIGVEKATENLFVQAHSNWTLPYDNVTSFGINLAMVLSVFTTGANVLMRKKYSDLDVISMSAKRPIILNYISQPHSRSDLMDRSIVIQFKALTGIREDDQTMRANMEIDLPIIRAFIFETLAKALHLMKTEPVEINRADRWRITQFYKLGRHIEKVLNWKEGTFHNAIWEATNNQALVLLQNDEIAIGIKDLTSDWAEGQIEKYTPTNLFNAIKANYRNSTDDNDTEKLSWWARKTVPVFSRDLQNIKDELKLYGLKLLYQHSGNRLWIIEKITYSETPVQPDQTNNLDGSDTTIDIRNLDDDPHDLYEQGLLE